MHRVFGALLLVLPPAAALAAVASDPGATARAILKRDRYQTELPRTRPEGASPEPRPTPWRGTRHDDGGDEGGALTFELPAPSRGLTIVVVVLLLAAGLALLLRRLPPLTAGAGNPENRPAVRTPRPARARAPDDPEVLAQEGRFAEAIHALLLRALMELGRRTGSGAVPPASTSREVLKSASLGPAAREALVPLVGAVEWMYFGRGRACAEDYAACAEHYQRFREACRATG
jgi:hypothetical protein